MIELQAIVDSTINSCISKFSRQNLHTDEVAVTLVDMQDAEHLKWAGYRQDEPIYPASVVKLFYAIAAYHWLEQGKIGKTAEFDRSMRDMLVDSSNDATSYLVDLLTNTTSGPELDGQDMIEWSSKRNTINEFLKSRGYAGINVNQKPWGDGPYGRERVFVGQSMENRNKLTTRATADLLTDIVMRRATLPEYCDELLNYIQRDRNKLAEGTDDQSHGFIGGACPSSAQFWSKAGWTSTVRHDAAYLKFNQGKRKVCLVVFTVNHSKEPEILQAIGSEIISAVLSA